MAKVNLKLCRSAFVGVWKRWLKKSPKRRNEKVNGQRFDSTHWSTFRKTGDKFDQNCEFNLPQIRGMIISSYANRGSTCCLRAPYRMCLLIQSLIEWKCSAQITLLSLHLVDVMQKTVLIASSASLWLLFTKTHKSFSLDEIHLNVFIESRARRLAKWKYWHVCLI